MAKINIANGIISSSADYGLYRGTSKIVNIQDGEFRVLGDLIAENYIVSSSVSNIEYQSLSGSTIFGDSADDTHTFLGNTISGSATSTGSFGALHTAGRVGIGTTSQKSNLTIQTTANSFDVDAATGTLQFGSVSGTPTPSITGRQTAGTHGLVLMSFGLDGTTTGDMIFNTRENNNSTFATTANAGFKFQHFSTDLVTILRNGKVGIGTDAPDTNLHIHKASAGSVTTNTNSQFTIENNSHASMQFLSPTNANSIIYFGSAADNDIGYINYVHSTNTMNFQTNTAIRMTISGSGNVGIGTTGPSDKLQVNAGAGVAGFNTGITIQTGDGSYTANRGGMLGYFNEDVQVAGIRGQRAATGGWKGNLQFFTHNSTSGNTFGTTFLERMRIDESGNVGIGTASPGATLHIVSNSDSSEDFLIIEDTDTTAGSQIPQIEWRGNTSTFGFFRYTKDGAFFRSAGESNLMHVSGSGQVGIGTTSPGHQLDIVSSGNAEFELTRTSGASIFMQSQASKGKIGTSTNHSLDLITNAGSRVTIDTSGNLEVLDGNISGSATSTGSFGAGYIDNKLGVGTVNPKAPIHIFEDNYSTVMADPITDTRLFVSDIDGGSHIGIQSNLNNSGSIYFGHRTDIEAAKIVWDNSTDSMNFYSGSTKMFDYSGDNDIRFFKSLSSKSIFVNGGVHIGGTSNPGFNNLIVTGIMSASVYHDINVDGEVSASGVITADSFKVDNQFGLSNSSATLKLGAASTWTKVEYGKNLEAVHEFRGVLISGSSTSTASFGTFIGDGSQLSGISSDSVSEGTATLISGSATSTGSFGSGYFDKTLYVGTKTHTNRALKVHGTSGDISAEISNDATSNAFLRFSTDLDGTHRSGIIGMDYSDNVLRINHGGSFDGTHNGIEINSNGAVLVSGAANTPAVFESTDSQAKIQIKDDDTSAYIVAENTKIAFGRNSSIHTGNIVIDSSDRVGIGTTSPAAKLEIQGANGTVSGTPETDADELVIRNNSDAGINILAGEGSGDTSGIVFGSTSDINGANIHYNFNDKLFRIGTQHASGILTLRSGNGTTAVTIDATQDATFANTAIFANNKSINFLNTSGAEKAIVSFDNSNITKIGDSSSSGTLQLSAGTATFAGDVLSGGDISGSSTSTGSFGRISVNGISISDNDDGSNNTIFGRNAATSFGSSTANNIIVGPNAADAMDGGESHNIVIGQHAMGDADEGASGTVDFNVVIGNSALRGGAFTSTEQLEGNIAIGYQALNKDGDANTSIGQVAIGYQALKSMTSGNSNVSIGYKAGTSVTTGHNNVAIGNNALLNSQDIGFAVAIGNSVMASGTMTSAADGTVAIGQSTLTTLTSGIGNVAVGYEALKVEDDGDFNTAIGYQALTDQTGVSGTVANTAVGYYAGTNITTGIKNTMLGAYAGYTSLLVDNAVCVGYNAGGSAAMTADADGTVAIGMNTLTALTSGIGNTAVGFEALNDEDDGDHNTAVGYKALTTQNASAGNGQNTAVGYHAGKAVTTGIHNTVIGNEAGDALTSGDRSVAIGSRALSSEDVGNRSIAIGFSALNQQNASLPATIGNIGIGVEAGFYNVTGTSNTFLGYQAGFGSSGDSNSGNTAVGFEAGHDLSTGGSNSLLGYRAGDALTTGHNNVAVGIGAMGVSTNVGYAVAIGDTALGAANATNAADGTVAIGTSALRVLTSGIGNTAVGYQALLVEDDGDHNTAIGYQALVAQTGTSGTVANTAVGYKALDGILTGTHNVAVGANALGAADGAETENVGIGFNAGINLNNGSNNIAIGSNTNFSTAAASNQVVIGKDATGVANNSVTLGNADVTAVYMAQDSGATIYGAKAELSADLAAFDDTDLSVNAGLTIRNTANANNEGAGLFFKLHNTNGQDKGAGIIVKRSSNTQSNIHFVAATSSTPATKMVIEGSGNVGIGTSSPSVALEVAGTISGSLINSSGDVVAFNTSDERLKDNIKVIKEPIEKIKQLRGVEYQWNEKQNTYPSGSLDSGIIAQDVQKVLPQLVKERGDGYLGVRQERLVGLLIESIKDQQDQIDNLRKQIKEMKDGSS